MPRPRALVRQWNLLRVLSQHSDGLSIEEMARLTAVNARTIRRDLHLFMEAGISLRETISNRNKKRWRVDQHGGTAVSNHTAREVLAIWTAEQLLQPYRGTQFFAALERCRERLHQALGQNLRRLTETQIRELDSVLSADANLTAERIERLWDSFASGAVATLDLNGTLANPLAPASPTQHSAASR